MFHPFEFIPFFCILHYNIDKSNKEEINMYNPNNREEIKAMQGILPFNAFGIDRKRVKIDTVIKPTDAKHTAVWMDTLRENPMLPVDSAFLVRLYRCA